MPNPRRGILTVVLGRGRVDVMVRVVELSVAWRPLEAAFCSVEREG